MLVNTLEKRRRGRGYSQQRLAEQAGISRQSYSAIEAGRSVPSTEVALRLSAVLGCRVEELFRLPESGTELISARWVGAGGRRMGRRVRIASIGGSTLAIDLGGLDRTLRPADGLVTGEQGGNVLVEPFGDRPPPPALLVAGCDPGFGLVAERLKEDHGLEAVWLLRNTTAALEGLAAGEFHVAGVHSSGSGADNAEGLIARIVPFPCTRVVFGSWEQDLVLGAGNPLGVSRIEDLADDRLRFLQREPGSGSRVLLDRKLAEHGMSSADLPFFGQSTGGHYAIAEAVASGLADAGIAIRAAAEAYRLDVIPMATERYELVIPSHFLDLPAIGAMLDLLRVRTLTAQIEALGGYDLTQTGTVL